jgi:rSAM/selenodomain-associated transferase 2
MGIMPSFGADFFGLAGLYAGSFTLMILLIHFFPDGGSYGQGLVRIFTLAALGRFLLFALPLLSPVMVSSGASAAAPSHLLFSFSKVVSDLLLIWVIAGILRMRKMHPKRLLLYAANPLVLVTVTDFSQGYPFLSPILFVAFWLLIHEKNAAGFIVLGGMGVHPWFAAPVWPYLVNSRNWKKALMTLLVPAGVAMFCWADSGFFHWWRSTDAGLTPGNGLMGLSPVVFGEMAGLFSIGLFVGCLAIIYLVEPVPLRSMYLGIAALVLCFSPLAPWHMVLVAPFLCFYPSVAWFAFQWIFFLWFPEAIGHSDELVPVWLKWSPPSVLLGLTGWAQLRNRYPSPDQAFGPPSRIAVIIPALNESATLAGCIDSLRGQAAVSEIIVADGGSDDDTCLVADQKGARVVQTSRGRGVQIAAATDASDADVFLILHSDCRLLQGATERIIRHLTSRPDMPGGALGMRFDDHDIKMGIISILNNMRARYSGIAFGDQGQFVRREALSAIGGFPALALMEDVELSMQLKSIGRPLFLPNGITVSGRRWKRTGFGTNIGLVLRLCFRYLLERRWRSGRVDIGYYFRAYYGRSEVDTYPS